MVDRAAAWLRSHLAVVGFTVLAAGNIAGWASLQAEQEARLSGIERHEAQRCVDQWVEAASTRDAIEEASRIPSRALVEAVTDELGGDLSDLIDRYRSLVDDGVKAARAEIPDPDCDLDRARRQLSSS